MSVTPKLYSWSSSARIPNVEGIHKPAFVSTFGIRNEWLAVERRSRELLLWASSPQKNALLPGSLLAKVFMVPTQVAAAETHCSSLNWCWGLKTQKDPSCPDHLAGWGAKSTCPEIMKIWVQILSVVSQMYNFEPLIVRSLSFSFLCENWTNAWRKCLATLLLLLSGYSFLIFGSQFTQLPSGNWMSLHFQHVQTSLEKDKEVVFELDLEKCKSWKYRD